MPVAEWMHQEAQGILPAGDYEVTAIMDERKRGRTTEYIVKWKASRFLSFSSSIEPLMYVTVCQARN